jgi:hypothetical protein
MKTQNELIAYYTKNLNKVIASHGVDSDFTNYAFFLLQAVKINVPFEKIFEWAKNKCEALHLEALELI